jgi:cytochrome P450
MHPPAQNSGPRECVEDIELAGTMIPKGTILHADIFVMHHSPAVWKDPEAFLPERFASGGESESKAGTGLSWVPFGNGSRQCLGKIPCSYSRQVEKRILVANMNFNFKE